MATIFDNCVMNKVGNKCRYKVEFSVWGEDITDELWWNAILDRLINYGEKNITIKIENFGKNDDFELELYDDDFGETHYKFDLYITSTEIMRQQEFQYIEFELEEIIERYDFTNRIEFYLLNISNEAIEIQEEPKEKSNVKKVQGNFPRKLACNVYGLLLCWHFITSSPEPQPIEKLMMKITTSG
jgi:hypothetical protein